MATAYANAGGTGDRRALIALAMVGVGVVGAETALLNGNTTDTVFFFTAGLSTASLEFWFPSQQVIDEAKWYQSNATTHGTWQWQASNDRTTWTALGATFTLGGVATQTHTTLAGNTTAYLFYRLHQVGGTTSNSPWLHEVEFKIEEGGTSSYSHASGSGDRTATITITTSGIAWGAGSSPQLVNGLRTNQAWWIASANAGHWLQFDLGAPYVMQQARLWQDVIAAQGDWKWQGSPDASAWTDLSPTLTLGTAIGTAIGGFIGNTTAYRYYRLLGVAGSRTSTPYIQEIEFLLAAPVAPPAAAEQVQTFVVLPG